MSDSAARLDKQFLDAVQTGRLPPSDSNLQATSLTEDDLLSCFQSQVISRQLDFIARFLKQTNQSYYTIGSCGHEGNAAIANALRADDMAFLHYRSGAFVVQRMRQFSEDCPIRAILLSLMADKRDPIANGRHKVFGSHGLAIPPQTSTIASHLPKAVGTALSITRARELALDVPLAHDGIVLASFGDASCNHASAQSAFHMANWIAHEHCGLPLIFLCEDNGLGISVPTPSDWIEHSIRARSHIHYLAMNGLDLIDVHEKTSQAIRIAREQHKPVFLHMKCVRLMGHAGSDIETVYRSDAAITADEANDPLLYTASSLLHNEICSAAEIVRYYQDTHEAILTTFEGLKSEQALSSRAEIMASLVPTPAPQSAPEPIPSSPKPNTDRSLAQCINQALKDILHQYDNVLIFGEDVAKKGGVYHVTADLMQQFGQRRVFDTLLDETSILGTAIGFAHNGFIPMPEIQFLAYLHNAIDQLRGEAATLSFFSNGQYANPMVIRIPSFAYQKGFGGHFHNENSIAPIRDIPGIIIACPSRGADAAMMLRECVRLAYEQRRVVVFLEPIALYNIKDLHYAGDKAWLSEYPSVDKTIALGEMNICGDSDELAIVTYGNGFYLSQQVAGKIEANIKVIDLRWLAPLPKKALLTTLKYCKKILIVDECRQTASLSEALVTLFYESLTHHPKIQRITAADCFITLGESSKQLLPNIDSIQQAVMDMIHDH